VTYPLGEAEVRSRFTLTRGKNDALDYPITIIP